MKKLIEKTQEQKERLCIKYGHDYAYFNKEERICETCGRIEIYLGLVDIYDWGKKYLKK